MLFCFNAREVLDMAVAIEENGRLFYEKAGRAVEDPAVRAVFADLAAQEVEHKARFEKLRADLPPDSPSCTVYDPGNETAAYVRMMADQHVFRDAREVEVRVAAIRSAADALALAMQFEKDSVMFFLGLEEAADEKTTRPLIGALVKEEREHLRRLARELRKLTA